jgi:hypothetical protein
MHYLYKTLHHFKSHGSLLLGVFTYWRKEPVTFAMPVRVSGYISEILTGLIVVKFGIGDLHENVMKIQIWLKIGEKHQELYIKT